MQIIAVANNKGGACKTTTTLGLGSSLSNMGYRVLLVDLDAQGNLTDHVSGDRYNVTASAGHFLMTKRPPTAKDFVTNYVTSLAKDFHLLPSSFNMGEEQDQLRQETNYKARLRERLAVLSPLYDFVLLDCPPGLEQMNYNAFIASDWFVGAAVPESFAIDGLRRIFAIAEDVQATDNTRLQCAGIVFNRYNPAQRSRIRHSVVKTAVDLFGEATLLPFIREDTKVQEAQAMGQAVYDYAADSKFAEDYQKCAAELIKRTLTSTPQA